MPPLILSKKFSAVGHHGTRTVAWLSRGKILLTYASWRGEEKLSFQIKGKLVSHPVRTYRHWNLRDIAVPPHKEENTSQPFLSILLSLKT